MIPKIGIINEATNNYILLNYNYHRKDQSFPSRGVEELSCNATWQTNLRRTMNIRQDGWRARFDTICLSTIST